MAEPKEKKPLEKKYFKLGEGRTMFYDPGQKKDNQKLLPGDVKMLEFTKKVHNAKRGEHIVPADDDDLKAYKARKAEEKKAAQEAETAEAEKAK